MFHLHTTDLSPAPHTYEDHGQPRTRTRAINHAPGTRAHQTSSTHPVKKITERSPEYAGLARRRVDVMWAMLRDQRLYQEWQPNLATAA